MYPPAPQMSHYPGYQAPQMPAAHHYTQMPPQPPVPVGQHIKSEPVDRFPLMSTQYMSHQQAANGQGHFVLPRNAPAGVPQPAANPAARYSTPAAVPEIPPLPSLPQLDGAASDDEDDGDSPPPNHAPLPRSSHPSLPAPIPPLPSLGGIPPLPSLNGIPPLPQFLQPPTPGPTPGQSSAPSIPPLPNLGGAVAGEEINSDLDDSDSDVGDDPDESAGPDTDIVFCTYDKVGKPKPIKISTSHLSTRFNASKANGSVSSRMAWFMSTAKIISLRGAIGAFHFPIDPGGTLTSQQRVRVVKF